MELNLKDHTVKSYDKDIKSIAKTIDDMLEMALRSMEMAEEVIRKPQPELLEKIISHDYKINTLDSLVEKKVTTMLALRQPMAFDLRYVVSALRVAANIERIGDQAKSIIKKYNHMERNFIEEKTRDSFLKMSTTAKSMLQDAVYAFNNHDADNVKNILKEDDKIDQIYHNLFNIIGGDLTPERVKMMINVLFIAKSFERIADHATNIAEITNYAVTGEIISE